MSTHRSHELRVRAKSLAAEISIIKSEERRIVTRALKRRAHHAEKGLAPESFNLFVNTLPMLSLREHRISVVAKHARCTNLARGFERGLAYRQMEHLTRAAPDFKEIERLVLKYLPKTSHAAWPTWLEEAQDHLKGGALKAA